MDDGHHAKPGPTDRPTDRPTDNRSPLARRRTLGGPAAGGHVRRRNRWAI